jgi:hypothetical protein
VRSALAAQAGNLRLWVTTFSGKQVIDPNCDLCDVIPPLSILEHQGIHCPTHTPQELEAIFVQGAGGISARDLALTALENDEGIPQDLRILIYRGH